MTPRSAPPTIEFGMPRLDPWMRWVFVVLGSAFVLQLVAMGLGFNALVLAYQPLGAGFQPWQLLTHFVVWPPRDVAGVLFAGLVLYFLLPDVGRSLGPRRVAEGLAAAALAGTISVIAVDAAGAYAGLPVHMSMVLGWDVVPLVLLQWFGLARPDAEIRLYFLLPVPARWLVWGSLAIALLGLLSSIATSDGVLDSLEIVGAWAGGYAWWMTRGPGGRRRGLRNQGRAVEKKMGKVLTLPNRDPWH